MTPSSFWQGVQQFNQQQFYACHDTLEAIWIEAREVDKNFYQAILQIAVACYHLGNQNLRGAIILLGEGVKRLKDYQPQHYNVDVESLLEDAIDLLLALQHLPPEQIAEVAEQLNTNPQAQIESDQILIKLPKIKLIES